MAASTYLDVGVQRIGEYLTRVPKLAELRNASARISAATELPDTGPGVRGAAAQEGNLLEGLPVQVNTETGQADGVVHLVVDSGADPEALARELLARLRDRLPGAQLMASWAAASDYTQAFAAMHLPGSRQHILWLASTNEFPLARPCGRRPDEEADREDRGCGGRPGMSDGHVVALCPDCRGRAKRGGRVSRDSRAELLLADLGTRPDEISGLCPAGETPPRSNHVATIAMDGNGVGGVFASLIDSGTAQQRRVVSRALVQATRAAFQAAACQTVRGGQVNVIPVVLGGDDLIVVVAAVDAWAFARTMADAFVPEVRREIGARLSGGEGAVDKQQLAEMLQLADTLSVSGGITFHKAKHPITAAVQTSDALMRRAKRVHSGSTAAFCWVDMTTDALDEAPDLATGLARRPVATAAALAQRAEQLRALARFPHSTLGNLHGIIEELAELPVTDTDRRNYVLAQAARVDAEAAVKPFTYPNDTARESGVQVSLSTALDLARWWK